MLSRLLQFLNADPPIICRLLFSANSTSVRLLHPQNAFVVSLVTPSPITTLVIIVRLLYQGILASPLYVVMLPVPVMVRIPLLLSVQLRFSPQLPEAIWAGSRST